MSFFTELFLSTDEASDYRRDPANKVSNIWDRVDSGIKQAGRQFVISTWTRRPFLTRFAKYQK
jgi:hypothetical protein